MYFPPDNLLLFCSCYGDGDEGEEEGQRELHVLQGIVEHILPHVGSQVLTLDLSHSKAVSNEVVCHHNYHSRLIVCNRGVAALGPFVSVLGTGIGS